MLGYTTLWFIINRNTYFSLPCRQFSDIHISPGSVATYLKYGWIFKHMLVANLPLLLCESWALCFLKGYGSHIRRIKQYNVPEIWTPAVPDDVIFQNGRLIKKNTSYLSQDQSIEMYTHRQKNITMVYYGRPLCAVLQQMQDVLTQCRRWCRPRARRDSRRRAPRNSRRTRWGGRRRSATAPCWPLFSSGSR